MFKIQKTTASFGKINVRPEHHGDDIQPAIDVPFTIAGGKRLMDMIFRVKEGPKFSETMYAASGLYRFPDMQTIPIDRKPEALKVTIWDTEKKGVKPLEFADSKVKNLVVTFYDKFKCEVEGTVQLQVDAERDSARLVRLMLHKGDIEIIATQIDAFDDEDTSGAQSDIDDDQDDGDGE